MPILLVALFIIVPIAELAVIIQVGQEISVEWTIAILVTDSILGSLLMPVARTARLAPLQRRAAVGAGAGPRVADGVLVIFGGALLLTPGFLSDIFGILFLLPPTRAVIRRVFLRQAMKRITVSMAGVAMRRAAARTGPTTSRAPRSTSTRVPATRGPGSRRERRGGRRGPRSAARPPAASRSRSGTPARSSTGSRAWGSRAPDSARLGSALAVLFAGRAPVAAVAQGALAVAGHAS